MAECGFSRTFVVKPDDIDMLGHVNNVVYLRWVQDVAIAHWRELASPEEQATLLWVVVRHVIDYKRPAFMGDAIMARTWLGGAKRRDFERHTELSRASDGRLLAKACTVWRPIDGKTRKAIVVGDELRARFSSSDPI